MLYHAILIDDQDGYLANTEHESKKAAIADAKAMLNDPEYANSGVVKAAVIDEEGVVLWDKSAPPRVE
jgi:hypothetical protein